MILLSARARQGNRQVARRLRSKVDETWLVIVTQPGVTNISTDSSAAELSLPSLIGIQEATWLAAALLVPRAGALRLARGGVVDDLIARRFGVSTALCRWRMNETGISSQLQRYANLRRTGGRAAAK